MPTAIQTSNFSKRFKISPQEPLGGGGTSAAFAVKGTTEAACGNPVSEGRTGKDRGPQLPEGSPATGSLCPREADGWLGVPVS